MNTAFIYSAIKSWTELYTDKFEPWMQGQLNSEKISGIVKVHALLCTVAAFVGGFLSDGMEIAAMIVMNISLWSMYFRINRALGLKFWKTFLKSLGAAFLSNIGQNVIGFISMIILEALSSNFSLFGGITAIIIAVVMNFVAVVLGGIIYIKLLTKLFSAGKKRSETIESDLKYAVKSVLKEEDISSMLKNNRTSSIFRSN